MSDRDEQAARFEDLSRGPWAAGARPAFDDLRTHADLAALADSDGRIGLDDIKARLTAHDKAREPQLLDVFRPHWVRPVQDQSESDRRDALDRALETLVLVEIGLETGYLEISTIRHAARRDVLALLWSDGARQFVESYGYVAIRFLASRLDLDFGFPSGGLPPVFERAETRFAIFLAEHQRWYLDRELVLWTRFLDDYVIDSDERREFAAFLQSGLSPADHKRTLRFTKLSVGLERFCTYLADLHGVLADAERPYFGSVYLYMMSRFFGYRMKAAGFERNPADFDWAAQLKSSRLVENRGAEGEMLVAACDQVAEFRQESAAFIMQFAR